MASSSAEQQHPHTILRRAMSAEQWHVMTLEIPCRAKSSIFVISLKCAVFGIFRHRMPKACLHSCQAHLSSNKWSKRMPEARGTQGRPGSASRMPSDPNRSSSRLSACGFYALRETSASEARVRSRQISHLYSMPRKVTANCIAAAHQVP